MKLLIIEDNPESANLLIRFLTACGYQIVHRTHGLEGLKAAREEHFDAILLDFNLPDIDGSQIGLLLRSQMKNVGLIAITGSSDRVTLNKARKFGFDAFIAKPWSMVELLDTVQKVVLENAPQPQMKSCGTTKDNPAFSSKA